LILDFVCNFGMILFLKADDNKLRMLVAAKWRGLSLTQRNETFLTHTSVEETLPTPSSSQGSQGNSVMSFHLFVCISKFISCNGGDNAVVVMMR
jgi:hypothetical protein